YNLWLTPEKLSLWPQVSFLYTTFSGSKSVTVGTTTSKADYTLTRQSIMVNVPLLIHPAKHFHFGVGPFVMLDIGANLKAGDAGCRAGRKATPFGLAAEIAGWL